MKKLIWVLMAVAVLMLVACGSENRVRDFGTNFGNKKPALSEQSLGKDGVFKVDLLFEIDGYRVYRFVDNAHDRYLVIPIEGKRTAQVLSEESESNGKSTNYHDSSIVTVLN
jgi:hypothetical protein